MDRRTEGTAGRLNSLVAAVDTLHRGKDARGKTNQLYERPSRQREQGKGADNCKARIAGRQGEGRKTITQQGRPIF